MRKRNFLVYAGFDFINKGLPFLLIPVFTHYLSPVEYGHLESLLLIFTFTQSAVWFNQNTYFQKQFYNHSDVKFLWREVSRLPLLFAVVALVFLVLNRIPDSRVLSVYIAGIAFFSFGFQLILHELQLKEKALQFGLLQLVVTIVGLVVSVLLVLANYGATGRFLGITLAPSIVGLIMLLNRNWNTQRSQNHFNQADAITGSFLFGAKLLPHNLINGWLRDSAPKLVILLLIGSTEALGIYTVTFSFALAFNILLNSFMQVITPYIYRRESEDSIQIRDLGIILVLFVTTYLIVSPLLYFLFDVMVDDRFQGQASLIFLLSAGFVFGGFSTVIGTVLIARNRPEIVSFNSTVSVLGSIIVMLITVPYLSSPVTIIATIYALSFVFSAILNFSSWKRSAT